jgi:hypothetical protein
MIMKMNWKIRAIIGLVAVIALGAVGISYAALWSPYGDNKRGKQITGAADNPMEYYDD